MRKIWWRGFLLIAAILCGSVLAAAPSVTADVNDFTVTNFTADYTLDNSDKQGKLHVVEHIAVYFNGQNHGLLRAIPKTYRGHSVRLNIDKVSSDSGAPTALKTTESNDNEVLRIGDPNRTVTGEQSYTIEYTVTDVIAFYQDHDELYWDINGDQWAQELQKVQAAIHLPDGLQAVRQVCYAGSDGSDSQDCTVKTENQTVTAYTNRPLLPYQTLTTAVGFSKGYFAPATPMDWLRENYGHVIGVVVPPLLTFLYAFQRWRRGGKDLKGRGTIVPEYGPPDALTAAEVGVLSSYKFSSREASATIIDLAIRKYLRIIEATEDRLFKDKKNYYFELLKPADSSLKSHELTILKALFPAQQAGEKIDLSYLKNKFYKTIRALQKSVPQSLVSDGYFATNPQKAGRGLMIFGFVLVVVAGVVHSWSSIGFAAAALIFFGFAVLMPKRTDKGVAAKDAIAGLKLYMETAEKDRIAMLQSPDAPYAAKTDAPQQTVQLFEKLLPYAMVLGVEQKWARQFEAIYTTPPDWYNGNWPAFSAVYLASSLDSSMVAMASSFSAPGSSNSSGLGGGGSAGGGGGGGGGGGW